MCNCKRLLFIAFLLTIFLAAPAQAQEQVSIRLGGLNIAEFPKISTYADVRGPQGFFVSNLPANAATVFEDEQPLPGVLTEVRPGAQIVVAYAGGENFGIINLDVQTRYEVLSNWIQTWSSTQLEIDVDTLSLLVPEGVVVNHATDPETWTTELQNYQPDFNLTTSPLEILSAAIDNALDPLPREGMGRAVLFLTQGIPDIQQDALQSQVDRAAQAGVRLHIGYINSANLFGGGDAIRLQAAAAATGGQYFAFSSDEPLPDLNLMMESSRRSYLLEYRSQISTPGTHTITVMINSDSGELLSQTVSFEANLSSPLPVFIAPPSQIVRAIPPDAENQPENLTPTSQFLKLATEFPDNIPRQVTQVSLFVSDTLVSEVTEPPFDQITLDLTPYQESGFLDLRLEVTDELGLTGSSPALPVEIVVLQAQGGFFSSLGRNVYLIIGGVVGLSGAVLFLVLVLAGRLRPRRPGERARKRKAARDPVTSPLRDEQKSSETSSQDSVLERITKRLPASTRVRWPSRTRPAAAPFGHLVRVSEDGEPDSENLIPVIATDLTFGSDAKQAIIVLDNPAVSPLHARLWSDDDGVFYLEDTGSTSGTYLNYQAVKDQSPPLEHGDLIHIADIGYRFTLSKPTQTRKPSITPLNPPAEKDES